MSLKKGKKAITELLEKMKTAGTTADVNDVGPQRPRGMAIQPIQIRLKNTD